MVSQAMWSVVAGLVISTVAFVPLLAWQYRRYGAPSAVRMVGFVVAAVYASAVVAYTLFPLPGPGVLTEQFCAQRGRPLVLDPTEYFRGMGRELAGLSPLAAAKSWVVMQMVLNVALFVPLGVLGRVLGGWSAGRAVATGAAASLLIEATQYTGNWGLMACSYRLADVNDLLTNTTGTAVGFALAGLLPRLVADPEHLAARRHLARPVTRARRCAASLLDATIFAAALAVAWVVVVAAFAVLLGDRMLDQDVTGALLEVMGWVAVGVTLVVLVVPALVGSRASLGQRITYLRPVGRGGAACRLGPAALRGLATAALFTGWASVVFVASLWLLVDAVWALRDPRGLSGAVVRADVVDARAALQGASSRAGATGLLRRR